MNLAGKIGSFLTGAMVLFAVGSVPARAVDFIHGYQLYPDTSTINYDLGIQATPFSFLFENDTLLLSGSDNVVSFTDVSSPAPAALPAVFNGVEIVDLTRSNITNVQYDPSSTVVGFNQSLISFTPNKILLNYQGLPFSPGQSLVVDVVRSVSAVPEPSIWAMLIIGFGMVGFALRLRRDPSAAAA
jgi:hypothetical protein